MRTQRHEEQASLTLICDVERIAGSAVLTSLEECSPLFLEWSRDLDWQNSMNRLDHVGMVLVKIAKQRHERGVGLRFVSLMIVTVQIAIQLCLNQ